MLALGFTVCSQAHMNLVLRMQTLEQGFFSATESLCQCVFPHVIQEFLLSSDP